MNVSELQEVLESLPQDQQTPYGMSKLVNEKLGTDLPPQMFYNYVRKGFITATFSEKDGWRIEPTEVRRWIERYAFRNIVTIS